MIGQTSTICTQTEHQTFWMVPQSLAMGGGASLLCDLCYLRTALTSGPTNRSCNIQWTIQNLSLQISALVYVTSSFGDPNQSKHWPPWLIWSISKMTEYCAIDKPCWNVYKVTCMFTNWFVFTYCNPLNKLWIFCDMISLAVLHWREGITHSGYFLHVRLVSLILLCNPIT